MGLKIVKDYDGGIQSINTDTFKRVYGEIVRTTIDSEEKKDRKTMLKKTELDRSKPVKLYVYLELENHAICLWKGSFILTDEMLNNYEYKELSSFKEYTKDMLGYFGSHWVGYQRFLEKVTIDTNITKNDLGLISEPISVKDFLNKMVVHYHNELDFEREE